MKRIPVEPSESPRHRRAREQRQQLDKLATQLAARWHSRAGDPLTVEILRGIALAQSVDDAHPIDHHGRCTRWRCARGWFLIKRTCYTRTTLAYYLSADAATLWFHVFSHILTTPMSLAEVRT